ncbi:glycosyltransferase family 4 protein, partial [Vibrio sp. M260118]|uniref:glycosyltransferase family 4 protein n=1 Tax=Vibrio sp. M260118 TaxID=3020896 RepID=UPI002F429617
MSSNSSDEIWLVIDSLAFGGIETHVLELAKGLHKFQAPIRVYFVRRYTDEPLLVQKLQSNNISVSYLDLDGSNYLSNLITLVRNNKPALLHAHGYKASLVCKLTRLVTGVRQISTYHAGETPSGKVWWYDLVDRCTSFISNHSIAVSEKIAQKLASNSLSFNNFVDANDVTKSEGEQIAFVGRLSHEKGPDRFITLAKENSQHMFHVYGSGSMDFELKASASSNVVFHGHQDDMRQVWPLIGALVICSRFEGLPMTALEAMARGIPVFSLNVGNMPKLIEHNGNGYLAKDVNQLSHDLNHYLTLDHQQRSSIQQRTIESIQSEYSQSAVIPLMLELYFS